MTDIKKADCKVCKVFFPLTKKYFYVTNGKLKTSKCKSCKIKASAEYRKKHHEKYTKYAREWINKYNKKPENYERLKKRRKYVFQIKKYKTHLQKTNDPVKIEQIKKNIEKFQALHATTLLKNM